MAHRRFVRTGRARSKKVWGVSNDGTRGAPIFSTLDPGSAGLSGSPKDFFFGPEALDNTILRIRGAWNVAAQNIGIGELIQVSMGIGVVTEQAGAVLGSATPNPVDQGDWDGWMYHSTLIIAGNDTVTQPNANVGYTQVDIDSKAMRKVQQGDGYFVSFQAFNISAVGVPFLDIAAWWRILFKVN